MSSDARRELLDELGDQPEVSPIDPDNADYVKQRRRLLGPIADISHPEFGRENTPEETFGLVANISHPDGNLGEVRVISGVLDSAGVVVDSESYSSVQC